LASAGLTSDPAASNAASDFRFHFIFMISPFPLFPRNF
jgi:hypothetical protein